jgi:tricorn protease-like protein
MRARLPIGRVLTSAGLLVKEKAFVKQTRISIFPGLKNNSRSSDDGRWFASSKIHTGSAQTETELCCAAAPNISMAE